MLKTRKIKQEIDELICKMHVIITAYTYITRENYSFLQILRMKLDHYTNAEIMNIMESVIKDDNFLKRTKFPFAFSKKLQNMKSCIKQEIDKQEK